MALASLETLYEDFSFLDDWEDRYRYIIELGRSLPSLAEAAHNEQNKVQGCTAQVWITVEAVPSPSGQILNFSGDSDAAIVKGLVAIVLAIFSGKDSKTILATDEKEIFRKLGLEGHLTQQRSNGLAAMVARLKAEARRLG